MRGQNVLISVLIGVVGGLIGFAVGWYQHRQTEGEQKHSQSEDDHKRWVNVIQNLEERVKDLDGYDCVVCFDNRRSVIFDCEHLVTCASCAAKLNFCPMCRARIQRRQEVRLYS